MFSRCFSLLLLACALATWPWVSVHAEAANSAAPPGYAEAINQALAELEANNFPEAREEFRRAHDIYPNARTLRGMGMVEFELRNYGASTRLLEGALASRVRPLDGKLRAETEGLLERARRYLGEIVVRLEPRNATLRVDGTKVDLVEGALQLEVGPHTLEAQAAGYASERRSIRIAGGERSEIDISLRSLEARAAQASETTASERESSSSLPASDVKPLYKKWWLWTVVVVVVAGGATAAALLATRERDTRTLPVPSSNTPPSVSLQTLERF